MIALIGLVVVVLFVVLWKSGVLDDLTRAGARARRAPDGGAAGPSKADPRRLDVFEEYIAGLPDDDGSAPPKV
jgi:hypothetical protein